MGFLKPKAAKQSSENVNNSLITSTYGNQLAQGTNANNYLSALLTGTGNTEAANSAYQSYLNNAGYQSAMRQLSQGITGQGAASGLLNSGATAKALQSQGAALNQQYYNNYLQQLTGLSNLGLQAGGLIANTGQKSSSTGGSPSTLGSIASTVGGIASIFSDRRLKRDIEKIDECADGLGIYQFRYVWSPLKVLGVMADEVAKLRPWALGPSRFGFATVNYEAL